MGISIISVYYQTGNVDNYNSCILSYRKWGYLYYLYIIRQEMGISIISVYYHKGNGDIYNICISPDRKYGFL